MSQIRDQKCACEIYPAIYRRSGAIGIRAVSARLSRLFRSSKPGDWGRSHQVEDQRGGATPHACYAQRAATITQFKNKQKEKPKCNQLKNQNETFHQPKRRHPHIVQKTACKQIGGMIRSNLFILVETLVKRSLTIWIC
jgi:hypothetical protein